MPTSGRHPHPGAPAHILAQYDHELLGPLFAVSDEGSAGPTVLAASQASAKARALAPLDPFRLGVVLDGERMTSAGEVPIGPPEYAALITAAAGRLLLTTNVGVRANARPLQQFPTFELPNGKPDETWCEKVCAAFDPFLSTPDCKPRPLTVRLRIPPSAPSSALVVAVKKLETRRSVGQIGPRVLHRFAALVEFEDEIITEKQFRRIETALNAAQVAGLDELAIDGELLPAARKRLGVQSLLNVLEIEPLRRLLRAAAEAGVRLTYRYPLDVQTAARTIWTGLEVARARGFTAGKYGLVPFSLEEQAEIMELVTRWTAAWNAIPAFYVDTPLLTATQVYDTSQCAEAARLWLRAARGAGASVVLFDSPDRVDPRRLLKSGGEKDLGVLTLDEVEQLSAYAHQLGLRILWSGGITSAQAYELARRRVFGIFSTSSTAAKIAVTAQFANDPRLPAENEPTEFGVRRMHALIQAGFLSAALGDRNRQLATEIASTADRLLAAETDADRSESELKQLDPQLITGWRNLLASRDVNVTPYSPCDTRPVPPDAVRVFRGRRQRGLTHEKFVEQLGMLFMPLTVQMQRLYGLTAYLPAVLPPRRTGGLPHEVALVFYRTQSAYHEAKQCIGGRAYSESHRLVFDMDASKSDFPQLFIDEIKSDQPYYLFERSVDWQAGYTRLYVCPRSGAVKERDFLAGISRIAMELRGSPAGRDAVIFCVSDDSLIWWEHARCATHSSTVFDEFAVPAFTSSARRLRLPDCLTEPYSGLSLAAQGDFVNLQFARC